jgi:putative heme-binding domain-containing protein
MTRHSLILLLLSPALFAQRNLREIPSTDPTDQQKTFQLAEGLEVQLFASEPMVRKPIQMAWDARGRLWVASSAIYPHIKPGQTQSDQILILEDTNQDGKADKSTVFYEGLLIPTGIWPQDGGVYVANSTELLFMQDTNGDDKCDTSKVLLSGFGTEDTHHILHTIKGGPDGNLYFNQSVYIHSHIETPFGVRRLMGTGIWQFQPRTGRLEVFSMGQVNPWGHIFDDWGQSFTTDGAFGEGINYAFPGATFRCLPNQLPRILTGMNPGQPKQCGLTQITGTHFSAEWQGQLITCDFRGHRVNRFALTEEGSGYRSKQLPDLMSSTHGSFRPVDVNIGPDGAIYLADWFNPIIQHGEVDFRDPRRDQVHGRIWRVSMKNHPLSKYPDLTKSSDADVLENLKSPDQAVRYWAKQEMKSRKIKQLPSLLDGFIKKNPTPNAILEAIWTAQTAGVATLPWVLENGWLDGKADRIDHPQTRAAVVRVIRQMIVDGGLANLTNAAGQPLSQKDCETLFQQLCNDVHPRVRLEAVNLLRAWGSPRAIEIAASVVKQTMDENIDFALWRGCYELSSTWLPALQRGEITFADNSQGLLFALKAANQADASGLLLDIVEKKSGSEAQRIELLGIIGSTVNQAQSDRVLNYATASQTTTRERAAALQALITAQQQRQIKPRNAASLVGLLGEQEDAVTLAAAQLAGWWKLEEARARLQTLAAGNSALASAAQLGIARLGGPAAQAYLEKLLGARGKSPTQSGILLALMQLDLARATPAVVQFLGAQTEASPSTAALIDAYLTRQDGPALLANALQNKTLKASVASQALQKTSASGGDTKALMEALTKAGGLTPITALDAAQMTQLMNEVKTNGNPQRGEAIYRRLELQCATCHAIGPVGGIIGPNLVSIGSSAPVDYIIDSLLLPSKKIKEGYATAMIQLKDGANHTGYLTREDDKEILLTDAAGQVRTFPKNSVSKKEIIPVSLMPAGLTNGLRRDELTDLVRFLSELGKEGSYKVQEDGTLRQWFAHQQPDLTNPTPVTTWVDGSLPAQDLPVVVLQSGRQRLADTKFEVITAGEVVLQVSAAAEARWAIDGKTSVVKNDTITINLEKGTHVLRLTLPESASAKTSVRIKSTNAKPQHAPQG